MKKILKVFICMLLIIIIMSAWGLKVDATSAIVKLTNNKSRVKANETFSVTIQVSSGDGINGIYSKFEYDESKLELISEDVIDDAKWAKVKEESDEIIVFTNSKDKITSAELYKLNFKVKSTQTQASTTTIKLKDIIIDTYANDESYVEIASQEIQINIVEELKIASQYNVDSINKRITKISPNTNKQDLDMSANYDFKIYNSKNEVITNGEIIKTGMVVTFDEENVSYKLVVNGDINGDGFSNTSDMFQINAYRLKNRTFSEEQIIAADVNNDGKVDIKDMFNINKYRLGMCNL